MLPRSSSTGEERRELFQGAQRLPKPAGDPPGPASVGAAPLSAGQRERAAPALRERASSSARPRARTTRTGRGAGAEKNTLHPERPPPSTSRRLTPPGCSGSGCSGLGCSGSGCSSSGATGSAAPSCPQPSCWGSSALGSPLPCAAPLPGPALAAVPHGRGGSAAPGPPLALPAPRPPRAALRGHAGRGGRCPSATDRVVCAGAGPGACRAHPLCDSPGEALPGSGARPPAHRH